MSLHNLPDIQTTLKLLYNPGDVVESRVLHTPRSGTVSGYFDDMDKLANAAVEWSGQVPGGVCHDKSRIACPACTVK